MVNDHKPLKTILVTSLLKAPPRIQRFMLRLQRYNFEIEHAPGKTVVVADTLSRAYLPDQMPDVTEEEMEFHIHVVMQHLPMTSKQLLQYQHETKNDEALKVVIDYVRNGWPASKKGISSAALTYYSIRDQITVVNELVLKCDRLIVPSTLQKGAIQGIHNGHQGTDKCQMRARDSVCWPGISNQIKQITSSCSHCLD